MLKKSKISQHSDMGFNAACQGVKVVPAFQAGHDSTLGVALCHRLNAPSDPAEIGLGQAQLAQIVLAVGVEARADEDHFGLEVFQPGDPDGFDDFADMSAPRV
jgi:hypothetical protein